MFTPKHQILAGAVLSTALAMSNASAATFADDFNTAHDYYAGGAGDVSGTIWSGIHNVGALKSTTAAGGGVLTLGNNGNVDQGWAADEGKHNAPFLYINITGDFDVSVDIADLAGNGNGFPVGGLMFRDANAVSGEDWLTFAQYDFVHHLTFLGQSNDGADSKTFDFDSGPGEYYGSTDGTNSMITHPGQEENYAFKALRVTRTGGTFDFYAKANPGDLNWQQIHSTSRADLGSELQVGLQYANYSTGSGAEQRYDNFSVTTVPEPSTGLLAAMASTGLIMIRKRKR